MTILLDEIPCYLKRILKDYSVATVQELGLSGTKNGALLSYQFRLILYQSERMRAGTNIRMERMDYHRTVFSVIGN